MRWLLIAMLASVPLVAFLSPGAYFDTDNEGWCLRDWGGGAASVVSVFVFPLAALVLGYAVFVTSTSHPRRLLWRFVLGLPVAVAASSVVALIMASNLGRHGYCTY